jgi:hypothetical protein
MLQYNTIHNRELPIRVTKRVPSSSSLVGTGQAPIWPSREPEAKATCIGARTQPATATEAVGPAACPASLGLSGRRFVFATSLRFGGQTHPNSRRSELVFSAKRKAVRSFLSPDLLLLLLLCLRRVIQPSPSLLPNESDRAM